MELIHPLLYLMYIFSSAVSELNPHHVEKFEMALKSRFFVDRTLFLKDFMNEAEQVIYITAPPQSGKSTIIDMVTAFFDLDNKISENETLENSSNFRLFCSPGRELRICEERRFIEEHMGKYHVVLIDYKRLASFGSYGSLLQILKRIYTLAYEKHKAILKNKTFVKENAHMMNVYNVFKKPTNEINIQQNTQAVKEAILELNQALYSWTGKYTILLIDEYDAFGQSLLINPRSDKLTRDIINLMEVIHSNIFESRPTGIKKSLITGVLSAKRMGLSHVTMEVVRFHENKEMAGYYRLNEKQVGALVQNVSCDYNATMAYMKENYGGYCVSGLRNVTFYSGRHVFQYLESTYKYNFSFATDVYQPLKIYDHLSEKIKFSKSFIREINQLLSNQAFTVRGFETLSYNILENIAHEISYLVNEDSKKTIGEFFFTGVKPYLYSYYVDIGYLTITDKNTVRIPNKLIEQEFTKIMHGCYL